MNKKLGIYLKGAWLGWFCCRMISSIGTDWKLVLIYGLLIIIWLLTDLWEFKKDGNRQ